MKAEWMAFERDPIKFLKNIYFLVVQFKEPAKILLWYSGVIII